VTTWRHFAGKTFPRVVHELGLPAATPTHNGPSICPLHRSDIGPVTKTCLECHRAAWDEIARRYATADQGVGRKAER
jgi:hypothetical protein